MGCSKPEYGICPYPMHSECPQHCQFFKVSLNCALPKFIEQFTTDELLAEIRRRMGT